MYSGRSVGGVCGDVGKEIGADRTSFIEDASAGASLAGYHSCPRVRIRVYLAAVVFCLCDAFSGIR